MRALVIGGGISGMEAATSLVRRGMSVTMVTKNLGGLLSSHLVRNPFGPYGYFEFDYGGHVYSLGTSFHRMLADNENLTLLERKAFYLEMIGTNNWVPYPVQDFADQLVKKSVSSYTFGQVPKYGGQSLETFAIEAFGAQFYHDWFEHFNSRVWTTSPDKLDSDWIASRIKLPSAEPQKNWGPNSKFFYIPGNRMIEAVVGTPAFQEVRVVYGNVIDLAHEGGRWEAVYDTPKQRSYMDGFDVVVNTMPIASLLETMGKPLRGFSPHRNRIMLAGVMINGITEYERDFTWLYPDIWTRCHRVTNLSAYSPDLVPDPGCSSLLFEFPYDHRFFKNTKSAMRREFESDLHNILDSLGVRNWTVSWFDSEGYPVPELGIRAKIASIKRDLLNENVYTIGRWGSHAYLNADHCIDEARAAVNLIDTFDDPYPYLYSSIYYLPYRQGVPA